DAFGRRDMAHGLAVAAVEREGDAHLFGIVASDLEAVRAPAQVRSLDGDLAIVPAFVTAAGMSWKQKPMDTHHPVNPLAVHGRAALGDGVTAQDSPDARIA